jgi:hypothetical protein
MADTPVPEPALVAKRHRLYLHALREPNPFTFGLTWIRADRLVGDKITDGLSGPGTDPSCRRDR